MTDAHNAWALDSKDFGCILGGLWDLLMSLTQQEAVALTPQSSDAKGGAVPTVTLESNAQAL